MEKTKPSYDPYSSFLSLFSKFYAGILKGEFRRSFYLSYYYIYLKLRDLRYGVNFSHSHAPYEMSTISGAEANGTGNFPANPRIIRKIFKQIAPYIDFDAPICDIGCGSGIVLHVLSALGYRNLTGIEYAIQPFNQAVSNLSPSDIRLLNIDAFDHVFSDYKVLLFFSPFRDELALNFFKSFDLCQEFIVTVNHSPCIEAVLFRSHDIIYSFNHPIYDNFNGKIWRLR